MGKIVEYFKYDLRRVMYPLAYHGAQKAGPFFEGWYFKMISADGKQRISIIPGIYTGKEAVDSHSFIQVMDGVDGSSRYIRYPASKFRFTPKKMDISIASNKFSRDKIVLNIQTKEIDVSGELLFGELSGWPVRFYSPGVMGWYAWVPGMECYHGIVSMDHHLDGSIKLDKRVMDFTGGRGYIEKDWGRAMPRAWIWMQSNHFGRAETGVSISIAEIPWEKRSFDGFLAGFLFDGKLYRFTTYTGARIKGLSVTGKEIQFSIEDRTKKIRVSAKRAQGINLQAPTVVQMDRRIMETLHAEIEIQFLEKRNRKWNEVFSGTGKYAGLEVVGMLRTST